MLSCHRGLTGTNMKRSVKHISINRSENGAALLAFMLVFVIGSSFMLVSKLNAKIDTRENVTDTYNSLNKAKMALISYALTMPERSAANPRPGPGYLPCPDTDNDGDANTPCGTNSIGRIPYETLEENDLLDDSGETLWYALSDNFRNIPTKFTPLNSETSGQLSVDGQGDIVAVIIAPGVALNGQQRGVNSNLVSNYLEGENSDGDVNFISYLLNDNPPTFNDRVIAITRAELMQVIEKRVLSEFQSSINSYRTQEVNVVTGNPDLNNLVFTPAACNTVYDPGTCQPVYTYKFPWLSPYSPPAAADPVINGVADSGSDGLLLVDNDLDFNSLGIIVNDIVQNTTDGTLAIVNSVSSNILDLSAWDDSNNQFDIDDNDDYEIPRFNGIEGTQQGHIPYHEDGEAFLTGYTIDWTALASNLAVIATDSAVTHSHHQNGMETAIETSTGTTSSGVAVDFFSGGCVWTNINSTECFGRYTDKQFLKGTATSGTAVNGGASRVKLVDTQKNFTSAGIKRGDLLANYTAMSSIASVTGSATAGSDVNLLEDTGQNFLAAAIVPYYFVVEKDATGEIGIIQDVTATTLTLASVDEDNDLVFADTDDYTIRPIVQSIVTSVGSVSDDTLNGILIDGAATLDFAEADDYRIRVASKNQSSNATWPTPGGANPAYVLYDSTADFSGVRVGDVLENTQFSSLGVITAKGIRGDGIHWVAHTPLQGGTYDDIINGESYTIYHNYIDKRQYDINTKMTGVYSEVKAVNGEKVRDLCLDDAACSGGTIEYNNAEPMLTLRDFDQDETEVGVATLTIPSGGISGSLKLAGLHMDLIKGSDLPQWVVDNKWHHLMYLAFSEDLSPDYVAATDCQTDGSINCLQITGPGDTRTNVQSLVINAGSENTGQNRNTGAISDYFEADNFDVDEVFQQAIESNTFNDQIYVLQSVQ